VNDVVTKPKTVDYSTSNIGSDVPVTPNPSYSVTTKPYSKTSEDDDYNYVQPNELNQKSDFDKTIKMDINPSYGISTGKDRAIAFSTAKKAHHSSHNATTEQYNYICNNSVQLHQNRAINATSNSTKPTDKCKYDVINQPQSDEPNYVITCDTTASQQNDTLYI